MWASPNGSPLAPETRMLCAVGMTTVAAMKSRTTTSITRPKRFCWSQRRHSTW